MADIVVEELRKKEINGPIRLPKRDFFTRGQKLKVKDAWHILSGYDLEFAGMSTRERVRVMLEWFGRRQTIALPINSVVGCPDCTTAAAPALATCASCEESAPETPIAPMIVPSRMTGRPPSSGVMSLTASRRSPAPPGPQTNAH